MQFDLASTFAETIGGTVIGIIIGLFINMIAEWRSEWQSKMNLRRALIAELESAETLLEKSRSQETDIRPVLENIPRAIFDANADKIGGLSNDEVVSVTEFYSTLTSYQLHQPQTPTPEEKIERFLDENSLLEEIKEEHAKETSDTVRNYLESYAYSQINDSIDHYKLSELQRRRRTAQRELNSNLEPSIRKAILSKGPQSVSDIREIIRNKTKPDSWEALPLNQRMTLVAIAHLFKFDTFSQKELKERVNSENLSNIFTKIKI